MKTTKILLLGVTAAIALTATQNLLAADNSSQLASIMQNRALVHSPRMIEQFPELAHAAWGPATTAKLDSRPEKLADIAKNGAFANSPRTRELYPELAFSGQTPTANSSTPAASTSELARVMKNQSLTNSPRMKERFPELARMNNEVEQAVAIAPLK